MDQKTKGLIRILAGFLVLLYTVLAVAAMASGMVNSDWGVVILIGGLVSGGLIVSGVELIRSK